MIDSFMIGENVMLLERKPKRNYPKWMNENVAPNYFNTFLQE